MNETRVLPTTIPRDRVEVDQHPKITEPWVSFVIPALNEERFLARCLESIASLRRPSEVSGIEIVVVDNESTDRTVEIATSFGAKVVSVPPGRVSRARNSGVEAARGEWIAFVDADCELDPNWLVVCAPHLLDASAVAVGTVVACPSERATWVERTWFEVARPRGNAISEDVAWLPTFNVLVRREGFDNVGGFDETLETCEDCELGYRLATVGRLVRETRAPTIHHGESQTLSELFRREAWRSRGSWRLLRKRGANLREIASTLVPLAFAFCAVTVAIGLIVAGLTGAGIVAWSIVGGAVALLPLAILVRNRAVPASPRSLCGRFTVLATYLFARAVGVLTPFSRLKRGKAPEPR